jgi:hypothetical protein
MSSNYTPPPFALADIPSGSVVVTPTSLSAALAVAAATLTTILTINVPAQNWDQTIIVDGTALVEAALAAIGYYDLILNINGTAVAAGSDTLPISTAAYYKQSAIRTITSLSAGSGATIELQIQASAAVTVEATSVETSEPGATALSAIAIPTSIDIP